MFTIYINSEKAPAALQSKANGTPLSALRLKRGATVPICVVLLGVTEASNLRLGVKSKGGYEEELLLFASAAEGESTEEGLSFILNLEVNSTQLDSVLQVGSGVENAPSTLAAITELSWEENDTQRITDTLTTTIVNDIIRLASSPPSTSDAEYPAPSQLATKTWVQSLKASAAQYGLVLLDADAVIESEDYTAVALTQGGTLAIQAASFESRGGVRLGTKSPIVGSGVLLVGETPNGRLAVSASGLTAYALAVEEGFEGTQEDWLDSLKAEALTEEQGKALTNAATHQADKQIHISEEERQAWNATSDTSNSHTADTGAHLTAQEKTYLSRLVNNTSPPSSTGTLITDDDLSNANLHISLGLGSMAVGKNAVANNAYSTALGYGALTGAYYTSNNLTATITTVSTDRNGTYASSTPCFTTSIGFHASASRGGCTALGSYARAGDSLASSFGTQATAIGYFSSAIGHDSSAIGNYAQAFGYSSTAVGHSSTAEVTNSTAVGGNSYVSGFESTAIGNGANAYASRANAIGSVTCVVGTGATAIGNGCFVADAGVIALNMGGLYDQNGETYSNGMSTQLYLIGAGCTLSEDYLEGESGLGFIVLDHLSGAIVARGCCKLSSICTLHTTDFTPKNCDNISQY